MTYILHQHQSVTEFGANKQLTLSKWLQKTFGKDRHKWVCYLDGEYTRALVYEFAHSSHQIPFELKFSEYTFYDSVQQMQQYNQASSMGRDVQRQRQRQRQPRQRHHHFGTQC